MTETKKVAKKVAKKAVKKNIKGEITYKGDRGRVSSQGVIFKAGSTLTVPDNCPRRNAVIDIFQRDPRFKVA